jgi:hypothetical protein
MRVEQAITMIAAASVAPTAACSGLPTRAESDCDVLHFMIDAK